MPRFANDLQIKLVKGFNMVGRKGNGDQNEILLALGNVSLHSVGRLRAQPRRRADLRLPAEAVWVTELESVHDGIDCSGNLSRIRITYKILDLAYLFMANMMSLLTSVDNGHGQAVGGEEQNDILASLFGVLSKLCLDVLSECLYQASMNGPSVDDTPCNWTFVVFALKSVSPFPQLVHAASSGRARILRVLCKSDGSSTASFAKPILKELVVHFLGQRIGVSECDVWLVRCGFGGDGVEDFAHFSGLML